MYTLIHADLALPCLSTEGYREQRKSHPQKTSIPIRRLLSLWCRDAVIPCRAHSNVAFNRCFMSENDNYRPCFNGSPGAGQELDYNHGKKNSFLAIGNTVDIQVRRLRTVGEIRQRKKYLLKAGVVLIDFHVIVDIGTGVLLRRRELLRWGRSHECGHLTQIDGYSSRRWTESVEHLHQPLAHARLQFGPVSCDLYFSVRVPRVAQPTRLVERQSVR